MCPAMWQGNHSSRFPPPPSPFPLPLPSPLLFPLFNIYLFGCAECLVVVPDLFSRDTCALVP